MGFETIRTSVDQRGIATVTLARADKHNALNEQMIVELHEAAVTLGQDRSVRAVVMAAEGKSFCAGADLLWMREQAGKDRAGKISEALALANMLGAWNTIPKLLIARVQGAAYGGGVGLISVADIAIASEAAKFALTETRLGLIPATIAPFVVRRLGEGFARQVFFNSKPFGTDFALRAGLVGKIVPTDELDAAVEEDVAALLQCAPGAVAEAKTLCLKLGGPDPLSMTKMTTNGLADRWETDEARVGIQAFLEKSSPSWKA